MTSMAQDAVFAEATLGLVKVQRYFPITEVRNSFGKVRFSYENYYVRGSGSR